MREIVNMSMALHVSATWCILPVFHARTLSLGEAWTSKRTGFVQQDKANESTSASTPLAVKINLVPVSNPDPSVQGLIERVEDKRAHAEQAMFDQVVFWTHKVADDSWRASVRQHGGMCRNAGVDGYRFERT